MKRTATVALRALDVLGSAAEELAATLQSELKKRGCREQGTALAGPVIARVLLVSSDDFN